MFFLCRFKDVSLICLLFVFYLREIRKFLFFTELSVEFKIYDTSTCMSVVNASYKFVDVVFFHNLGSCWPVYNSLYLCFSVTNVFKLRFCPSSCPSFSSRTMESLSPSSSSCLFSALRRLKYLAANWKN